MKKRKTFPSKRQAVGRIRKTAVLLLVLLLLLCSCDKLFIPGDVPDGPPALTLTSGLTNIGNSLVWVFDELDAGKEYWGTEVSLGLAEGGVGIVTDKNFATYASDATKAAVAAAEEAVLSGAVVVDTAIGANAVDAVALRESVRP